MHEFAVAAAILAGCASFDGRGLEPGKSSAAEVVALMGAPAEKLSGYEPEPSDLNSELETRNSKLETRNLE